MEPASVVVFQVLMGVGLAACAGLRAFLPLLVVGIAGRLDWIPLTSRFEWLGDWPALVIFGVAVVVEVLADKIPLVDNLLDVLQGFVKPIAGTILMASVVTELEPAHRVALALILGAGTAGAVQLTKAKLRLLSSATTAGTGNPVLSVGEDASSLFGSLLALVAPLALVLILVASAIVLLLLIRRFGRFTRKPAAP